MLNMVINMIKGKNGNFKKRIAPINPINAMLSKKQLDTERAAPTKFTMMYGKAFLILLLIFCNLLILVNTILIYQLPLRPHLPRNKHRPRL